MIIKLFGTIILSSGDNLRRILIYLPDVTHAFSTLPTDMKEDSLSGDICVVALSIPPQMAMVFLLPSFLYTQLYQ